MAQIFTVDATKYVPLSVFADNPIRLAPEDHPNNAYSEQHVHYNKWWSYWKGYVLNKTNSNGIELYPVKLNIVRSSVINHAAALLGQFDDDQIVQFGVKSSDAVNPEAAKSVIKASNMLWAINNGDNGLLEQSLFQQVLGGCVYKVAWMPTRRKWPIRYINVDPRACFPIWDSDDPDRLVSMEVIHQVPRVTAAIRYRVDLGETSGNSAPLYATVHEKWTEAEYSVTVDGKPGMWANGDQMGGRNPFLDPVLGYPVVPFVYIPRIRDGDWWGDSLVATLSGPQNEINNNLAHLSEGVADTVHQPIYVKNRAKGTQGLNKARNEIIDLGMQQHTGADPEMGRIAGGQINEPMKAYVTENLLTMARESSNMPDVAFGNKDTSSIRSALTLKYMMWPTINVGLRYRKHMSTGFKQMAYMAFVIAISKKQFGGDMSMGIDAVTPDMIEATLIGHKTAWPPMLPDDRAEKVNEVVQRIAAGLISPETAVRRLDGPDELEEELNRIDEYRAKVAEEAMNMAEHQSSLAQAENSSKNEGKAKPKDRTNKAQAKGGRKSSPE